MGKKRKRCKREVSRVDEARLIIRADPPAGSIHAALAGQPFTRAVTLTVVGCTDPHEDAVSAALQALDGCATAEVEATSALRLHACELAVSSDPNALPIAITPSRVHSAPIESVYFQLCDTGTAFIDSLGFRRYALSLPRPRSDLLNRIASYQPMMHVPSANTAPSLQQNSSTVRYATKQYRRNASCLSPSFPNSFDHKTLSSFAEWVGGVASAGPEFRFAWSDVSAETDSSNNEAVTSATRTVEEGIQWAAWCNNLFTAAHLDDVIAKARVAVEQKQCAYAIVTAFADEHAPRATCGKKLQGSMQHVSFNNYGIPRSITVIQGQTESIIMDCCSATGNEH